MYLVFTQLSHEKKVKTLENVLSICKKYNLAYNKLYNYNIFFLLKKKVKNVIIILWRSNSIIVTYQLVAYLKSLAIKPFYFLQVSNPFFCI